MQWPTTPCSGRLLQDFSAFEASRTESVQPTRTRSRSPPAEREEVQRDRSRSPPVDRETQRIPLPDFLRPSRSPPVPAANRGRPAPAPVSIRSGGRYNPPPSAPRINVVADLGLPPARTETDYRQRSRILAADLSQARARVTHLELDNERLQAQNSTYSRELRSRNARIAVLESRTGAITEAECKAYARGNIEGFDKGFSHGVQQAKHWEAKLHEQEEREKQERSQRYRERRQQQQQRKQQQPPPPDNQQN